MSLLIDTIDLTGDSCSERDEIEIAEIEVVCEVAPGDEEDEAWNGAQSPIEVECYADSCTEDEGFSNSPSAFREPTGSFNTSASDDSPSCSSDHVAGAAGRHDLLLQARDSLSAYELKRLATIRENQGKLASLGLTQPLAPKRSTKASRTLQPCALDLEPLRRSSRAPSQRKTYSDTYSGSDSEDEDDQDRRRRKRASPWGADPSALTLDLGTLLGAIVPVPFGGPRPSKRASRADGTSLPPERTDEEEAVAVAHTRAKYREVFLEIRRCSNGGRADLATMKALGQTGLLVNQGARRQLTGDLPGLPVGTLFYNRTEMQVVGMHGKWLSGIDYVTKDKSIDGQPYATAVCSSGGYEDDEDNGETLWYTGEGGNDLLSSRRQTDSQRLDKGNLALHNSMKRKSPVRLLRCVSDCAKPPDSYTGKLYSYDGLYDVVEAKYAEGARRHGVFKFFLVRQPGQPPLASAGGARMHKRLLQLAQRDGIAGTSATPPAEITYDEIQQLLAAPTGIQSGTDWEDLGTD